MGPTASGALRHVGRGAHDLVQIGWTVGATLAARSARLAVLILTMRTILLASLAVLGACASDPVTPRPPMPSARAESFVDGAVPSTAAACLTRHTYPSLDLQFDCPTEHVGGDPDHWVTTCAVPDGFGSVDLHGQGYPLLRYEATVEAGRLLHELLDYVPGQHPGFIPWHDASYVYDSQHRLSEILRHDVNDVEVFHLVVGPRNAAGDPLSILVTVPPLTLYDVTYPATAHEALAYSYDASGRLVADQGTWADGVKYWDETISYDEVALRRDHVIIVDTSAEIHNGGGPGYNTRHEFLDATGHLIELEVERPGDPGPYVAVYRYDDQSRVSAQINTSTDGFIEKVDYIYECP